jgi:hypothetical protein
VGIERSIIMAIGAGHRAEPDRDQVRNRKLLKAYHDIPNVPFAKGRRRNLPTDREWPEATVAWWKALRIMPHCFLWTETDWQFALTTATLHAQVWSPYKVPAGVPGELRQRERQMGCTDEARRGLRIRYVDPEPSGEATVTPLHSVAEPAKKPARRVKAIDPSTVGGK